MMNATELYNKLDHDFIRDGITDLDWAARMPGLEGYLCENFKRRGMGLMCDFTDEIQTVYTTVFLSGLALTQVLDSGVSNALLFSHHPVDWGIEHHNGCYAADETLIQKFKERHIAIYVLHHPLDNYGPYATCKTLAEQLQIRIERPAFLFCGALCGVIGTVDCEDIHALHDRYTQVVGHKTSLYPYGDERLPGAKVAVCPGGGNDMFVLEEMLRHGVKNLITGVTLVNEHSQDSHRFEKENGINVFGGTHYSSEKFAPMAIRGYFKRLGLPSAFVADKPDYYDL